jgi:hypothetical protein
MSGAALLVLAIGLGTTMVLIVLIWALFRHLKVLLGALRQYADEIRPVIEQIQSASLAARDRAEEVPGRLPQRGPGVRLRKTS